MRERFFGESMKTRFSPFFLLHVPLSFSVDTKDWQEKLAEGETFGSGLEDS